VNNLILLTLWGLLARSKEVLGSLRKRGVDRLVIFVFIFEDISPLEGLFLISRALKTFSSAFLTARLRLVTSALRSGGLASAGQNGAISKT
jgi:hypothetical protein